MKKKITKPIQALPFVFGAAILLAGVLALVLIITQPQSTAAELRVDFEAVDGRRLLVYRELDRQYATLNPGTSFSYASPSADGSYDVRLVPGPLTAQQTGEFSLVAPWTGRTWSLVAKKATLAKLRQAKPALIDRLQAGTISPKEFEELLEASHSMGIQPLSLGNSHGWPYILWLQHWTATLHGIDSVATLPAVNDLPRYQNLEEAHSQLMAWKTKGWFGTEGWTQGWAWELVKIRDGSAAFALVSTEYLDPLLTDPEDTYEYFSFIKQVGDSPWSIGSTQYLVIPQASKQKKAAENYIRFLTSPGSKSELVKRLQEPYLGWDEKTKQFPLITASWAEAALSEEYKALSERFRP